MTANLAHLWPSQAVDIGYGALPCDSFTSTSFTSCELGHAEKGIGSGGKRQVPDYAIGECDVFQ